MPNDSKRFITVDDFGNIRFHKGEIPEDVISAADDGYYDVVDITNPDDPMIYMEEGWTDVEPLCKEMGGNDTE